MNMQSIKATAAVNFIIALLAVAPIYWLFLSLADTLLGTRQLLNWALYESRHALMMQVLADTGFLLITAAPLLAILVLCHTIGRGKHSLILAAITIAVMAGLLLFIGFNVIQIVIFAGAAITATLLAKTSVKLLC